VFERGPFANTFPSALFSNVFRLFPSINVRDQVPRAYKTTGKIIILHIIIIITTTKVKLSLLQGAPRPPRVARGRGSHIS
jgi:hypothetical protein